MRAYPDHYAETPDGLLFMADGVSEPRRWGGIGATTRKVGTDAPSTPCALAQDPAAPDPGPAKPATALTLAKDPLATPAGDTTTTTPIVGTYYAYVRYQNSDGVFSALSPISNELTLAEADEAYGFIYTDVPVSADPAVVRRQVLRNVNGDLDTFYVDVDTTDLAATTLRSVRYDTGLLDQTAVSAAASSNTAGIQGDYYAYVRFVNELGAVSNLSPVSGKLILTENDFAYGITYTGVPVPTQPNVVKRQILRNTAGQTQVFYVDVETTDLTATTLSSTRFDGNLSAQEAVTLLDADGAPLANTRGTPPTHKCVFQHHLGRMFLAVDRNYSQGGLVVQSGSTSVRGVQTDWTASMAGRDLWVKGATAAHEISAVDAATQTITLATAYSGPSDDSASYTIRPKPAERRLIYFSQAGEPEAWPAANALELQEDGDEITGLMAKGSFLFILEKRHVYKYSFQSTPNKDGFVFPASSRGCVNARCWAVCEDTAFMLDQAGIHGFADGNDADPVSDPIMHLFRAESDGPRINWQAQESFFCGAYPDEQTVRWFVAMSGERLPRHALCYDYRDRRWWIEEFDRPLGAATLGSHEGRRRVYLGGGAGTYLSHQGTLDGLAPAAGVTRGTATSADLYSLSDAAKPGAWPAALAGQTVTIVSGRGAGQRRQVVSQTDDRLALLTPWAELPDRTSVYQLGGVSWRFASGWMRFARSEEDDPRRVEVLFRTTPKEPASMDLLVYRDFSEDAVTWPRTTRPQDAEGFVSTKDSPRLTCDTAAARGFAQQRMDGHKEHHVEGCRFVSVALEGVTGRDPQALYQVGIDGVEAPGGS